MYVQVNIGRNVDGTPMSELRWLEFQFDVAHAIAELIGDLEGEVPPLARVEVHEGRGGWGEEAEDSAHLSVIVTPTIKAPQVAQAMTDFNHHLRFLAEKFDQEAIALVTGSRLIRARKGA